MSAFLLSTKLVKQKEKNLKMVKVSDVLNKHVIYKTKPNWNAKIHARDVSLFKINLSGENDEVRNLEGWMVKEVIQEFT